MLLSLLAMLAVAVPAAAQQGALTIPRNIQQLTERAETIVLGRVISARIETHPELGVGVRVVTLKVHESLKGSGQDTLTFRQYVWDVRERLDAANYRKGDEVLLLLIAPSRYGLTSPAGMEQGHFRIARDAEGRQMAVNGHGNARLFDGVDAQVAKDGISLSQASSRVVRRLRPGPVEIGELTGLIRDLVRGRP
jgi:hypothetical protein